MTRKRAHSYQAAGTPNQSKLRAGAATAFVAESPRPAATRDRNHQSTPITLEPRSTNTRTHKLYHRRQPTRFLRHPARNRRRRLQGCWEHGTTVSEEDTEI